MDPSPSSQPSHLSRLSRLYQPRNPLFWLMLVLNGLSPLLAWVVHNRPLNTAATLVVTCFALGNAVLGMWLAWRLLRDEPELPAATEDNSSDITRENPQDKAS